MGGLVHLQDQENISFHSRNLQVFISTNNSNNTLWAGLFFETALAAILIYVPGLNLVVGTRPLKPLYLFLGLPFALFIFIYDECRKYLIRRSPDGLVNRLTYY